MLSRRTFLKTATAVPLVGGLGCMSARKGRLSRDVDFFLPGFEGFAAALASARCRVGEGCRVTLNVREDRLLAAWGDDDRFRIVGTGGVEKGKWHLETRGICMEFMLRMEVMGPIASTPHPRPGQAWEPTLRAGDARRLMLRMLAECGVSLVYGCDRVQDFPAERSVAGEIFVRGQRMGTATALAYRKGTNVESILGSESLRTRLARDFSLPG